MAEDVTGRPVRRRQARGEQRMAQILDAAAAVFARSGYEAATTNAIAAEAGVSPGSLYQFFTGKEAIATALAERFTAQMREAHARAFEGVDASALTLPELLDRVIDPIVAFNIANPGFKALFARPDMPAGLAEAARPIQEALFGRVLGIVADRAPDLAEPERTRTARVLIQVFQAMVPLVTGAPEAERGPLTTELKHVLGRYLAPLTS
ncbi:TetR/AcrR family transcriptional regulator [Actinocorallia sp. A-T 12471]|uniref:TetR/AcrR family transcriptional regulator n=1 Tax=Actinocorallia sp. A-T 12471 TaxID=3089813 RepID=UPI0029CC168D|nr:TetR/AcrR family transcriptional regulator [Actinocorallia sp. A-T 12471]MDX6739160.1 TetR/AcrR family transcriptional regulator [Actinocorallia sp. A-T 12471]